MSTVQVWAHLCLPTRGTSLAAGGHKRWPGGWAGATSARCRPPGPGRAPGRRMSVPGCPGRSEGGPPAQRSTADFAVAWGGTLVGGEARACKVGGSCLMLSGVGDLKGDGEGWSAAWISDPLQGITGQCPDLQVSQQTIPQHSAQLHALQHWMQALL